MRWNTMGLLFVAFVAACRLASAQPLPGNTAPPSVPPPIQSETANRPEASSAEPALPPMIGIARELLPDGLIADLPVVEYVPETRTSQKTIIRDGVETTLQEEHVVMVAHWKLKKHLIRYSGGLATNTKDLAVPIDQAIGQLKPGDTFLYTASMRYEPTSFRLLSPNVVMLHGLVIEAAEPIEANPSPSAEVVAARPTSPPASVFIDGSSPQEKNAERMSRFALHLLGQGDVASAHVAIGDAIEAESHNPLSRYLRAYLLHRQGHLQDAEKSLALALEAEAAKPILNWSLMMEPIQGPSRVWIETARRANRVP